MSCCEVEISISRPTVVVTRSGGKLRAEVTRGKVVAEVTRPRVAVEVTRTTVSVNYCGQGVPGPPGPQGPPGDPASVAVKGGTIAPGLFTGSPFRATVTFGTAYPDALYGVTFGVEAVGGRSFVVRHAVN